jgi:hypothetical protein
VRTHRRRFTYANVTATLALVFAMGGGALATTHYLISSTKQINPSVLRKLRGRAGATGKEGPAGKQGPVGPEGPPGNTGERGPSVAFNTNSGKDVLDFPAKANEEVVVATLNLAAGSYAVFAKVVANNNGPTEVTVRCELLLGANVVDSGYPGVFLRGAPADRQSLSFSGTGTLASAGTAQLVCKVNGNEGNYLDRTITATQVASLG